MRLCYYYYHYYYYYSVPALRIYEHLDVDGIRLAFRLPSTVSGPRTTERELSVGPEASQKVSIFRRGQRLG